MSRIPTIIGLAALAACGPNRHNGSGTTDGHGGGNGDGFGSGCATSMVKADQVPLDIYIMLDQSSSMSDSVAGGGTKWTAVTAALNTFLGQPGLTGVSVGIQYFAVPTGGGTCSTFFCKTTADCGASSCGPCILDVCTGAIATTGDSCNAADYATANVEIAALPGVASSISSSMATHGPSTSTPTSAALQGAIDHASAWATGHAGDAVVAVLATDGDPTECDTSLPDIDAIAAAGVAAMPKILTFVIGVGSDLANLDGIAAAGGTTSAFLVDTGGNVNQQFLDAMNAIRHAALGCVYQIPTPTDGSMLDFGEVNVVYTPGNGMAAMTLPNVPNKAACPATGNAWYYNDPNMPTQIVLCDATCGVVEADATGEIDITLGCSTVIL